MAKEMNKHHLALRKSINDIIEQSHQRNGWAIMVKLSKDERIELSKAALYSTPKIDAGKWNGFDWCVLHIT